MSVPNPRPFVPLRHAMAAIIRVIRVAVAGCPLPGVAIVLNKLQRIKNNASSYDKPFFKFSNRKADNK